MQNIRQYNIFIHGVFNINRAELNYLLARKLNIDIFYYVLNNDIFIYTHIRRFFMNGTRCGQAKHNRRHGDRGSVCSGGSEFVNVGELSSTFPEAI